MEAAEAQSTTRGLSLLQIMELQEQERKHKEDGKRKRDNFRGIGASAMEEEAYDNNRGWGSSGATFAPDPSFFLLCGDGW